MAKQYAKREKGDPEFWFKNHWRIDHIGAPCGTLHSRRPHSKASLEGVFPPAPQALPGSTHLYKHTGNIGTDPETNKGVKQKQYSAGIQVCKLPDGTEDTRIGNCAVPKFQKSTPYQLQATDDTHHRPVELTVGQIKSELQYYKNQLLNPNCSDPATVQSLVDTYEQMVAESVNTPTSVQRRSRSSGRVRATTISASPDTPMSPSVQRSLAKHLNRIQQDPGAAYPRSPKQRAVSRGRFDALQVDVTSPKTSRAVRVAAACDPSYTTKADTSRFLKRQASNPTTLKKQNSRTQYMTEVTQIAETVPTPGEEWKSRSPIRPLMTNKGMHASMVAPTQVPVLKERPPKK